MRLGNYWKLKAILKPHFGGEVYVDDNAVVRVDDKQGRTLAYLWPVREGVLRVERRNGSTFEINVQGAGFEPNETPADWRHGSVGARVVRSFEEEGE